MDATLPDELQLLQRSVRAFVEEQLVPRGEEIEKSDRIPRDVIDAMAGMGLFGIGFPEDVGGQGFGKLGYCVAVEQLARANASLWNVIGGSAGLCGTAIDMGGPDELRARYLPDLLSAKRIGAYA
ncbi:MAG TPA: acyl-CoA dehydrogenase family protein, partial [Candidatus Limnocylindria bacterium]